jgi:hypothetical protein
MAHSSIRDARRFGAPKRAVPGASPSKRDRFARLGDGPPQRAMSIARTSLAVLAGVLIAVLAVAIPLALPVIAHRALAIILAIESVV